MVEPIRERTPREYPIRLSGAMVRALAAGLKSQTRIPIVPQPRERQGGKTGWWEWGYFLGGPKKGRPRSVLWRAEVWQRENGTAPIDAYSPWRAGDLLWVRETWRQAMASVEVHYRADRDEPEAPGCWRPSTQMPRWASRWTLRVIDVRAQRIQDITEEDAKAEGAEDWFKVYPSTAPEQRDPCGELMALRPHRAHFALTRDERYFTNRTAATLGWKANPWVWVYTFEREVPRG